MKSNPTKILLGVLTLGVVLFTTGRVTPLYAGALMTLSPSVEADAAKSASIIVSAGAAAVQSAPPYAYVTNWSPSVGIKDGTVSQYIIEKDGTLTLAATVAAGRQPGSITVDPFGKFAYVANFGNGHADSTVSQYSIGNNGALTPNTTAATVAAGVGPRSVTVDPTGKFAYVANSGDGVSQYTIGRDGALTINTPAMVITEEYPRKYPLSVTVGPSGKFAYVVYLRDDEPVSAGTVAQYAIGKNGALTLAATIAAGADSQSVTVDTSGKYAYVANSGYSDNDGSISQYTIGRNGALTPNSPAKVVAGSSPFCITVDPSGKYAYVANWGDGKKAGTISQYIIGKNGALTPNAAAATVPAGKYPKSIAIDPSGKYAYVTNYGSDTISQYTIGTNGALTPNATAATVGAGKYPQSIIITGTWQ